MVGVVARQQQQYPHHLCLISTPCVGQSPSFMNMNTYLHATDRNMSDIGKFVYALTRYRIGIR